MKNTYKTISGWGNYFEHKCKIVEPASIDELRKYSNGKKIARGMGRSYGDSSFQKDLTISTKQLNKILYFKKHKGIIRIQSGVTIDDLLKIIIPYGWFIPVTPGSKFISLGGAVSTDVHGKNHHLDGSIYNFINEITFLDAQNQLINCSQHSNKNLFNQVVGGMGLFGTIVEIELRLFRIENKYIFLKKNFFYNLDSILESFNKYSSSHYTVAWIDFMVKDCEKIKGILFRGRHAKNKELSKNLYNSRLKISNKKIFSIFFKFPNFILNNLTVKIFNFLYFHLNKISKKRIVDYDNFFYPLDKIHNWNNLYGRKGFLQYQFVIPENNINLGIRDVFKLLISENCFSFLTVIKKLGKKNNSFLSFPEKGITVTLDFKNTFLNISLLSKLDKIILKYNGNIYLAKDARVSADTFSKFYSKKFKNIKKVRKSLKPIFESSQSERINL